MYTSGASSFASVVFPIVLHFNNSNFMEKQNFYSNLAYPIGMLVLYLFSQQSNCSFGINLLLVILSMINGEVAIPFILLNFLYLYKKERRDPLILYGILNIILAGIIIYNYQPAGIQDSRVTLISTLTYLSTLFILKYFGKKSSDRIETFCIAGILTTVLYPRIFGILSHIFGNNSPNIKVDTLLCSSFLYILFSTQILFPITILLVVICILLGTVNC